MINVVKQTNKQKTEIMHFESRTNKTCLSEFKKKKNPKQLDVDLY